jgi:hypothetical protein
MVSFKIYHFWPLFVTLSKSVICKREKERTGEETKETGIKNMRQLHDERTLPVERVEKEK